MRMWNIYTRPSVLRFDSTTDISNISHESMNRLRNTFKIQGTRLKTVSSSRVFLFHSRATFQSTPTAAARLKMIRFLSSLH